MTGVNLYSVTAANNTNANTGVNWDEGMSPAAVNNSARQNMADTRAALNDLIWFRYGKGDGPDTVTYASATSLTVASTDVTAAYHTGRRIKAVGSGTGTIYGTISSSAFSTNTTINVTWDSGSLSNESLTVYLSQVPKTGVPISSHSIAGSALHDDAAAGSLGEVATATAALANSTLTTATGADVLTLSLSAGDWEVSGNLYFTLGSTTVVSQLLAWLNTSSTTAPSLPSTGYTEHNYSITAPGVSIVETLPINSTRFSLSTTTTIYLSCQGTFTTSTLKAGGIIHARRAR